MTRPGPSSYLVEAGYGDGFEVEVYTYVGDADFIDLPGLTEAVVGYLEAIGIKATVKVVDGQAFKAIFSGSNLDPEALKKSLADEPPYVLGVRGSDTRYHTFRTSYIWHHSKGKFGYNQDPNIADALLDKAAAAFDLNDQHDALAEYQLHMNRGILARAPAVGGGGVCRGQGKGWHLAYRQRTSFRPQPLVYSSSQVRVSQPSQLAMTHSAGGGATLRQLACSRKETHGWLPSRPYLSGSPGPLVYCHVGFCFVPGRRGPGRAVYGQLGCAGS